ncbi:MAG: hypothetical protein ACLP3R_06315 [Candidatus Korobacteraceae bacterium]
MNIGRMLAEVFGRKTPSAAATAMQDATQRVVEASQKLTERLKEPMDGFIDDVRESPKRRRRRTGAR